jgi:hypothetical protein
LPHLVVAVLGAAALSLAAGKDDSSAGPGELSMAMAGLWYQGAGPTRLYGTHSTAGLPFDIALGIRLTDQISVAAMARLGILHYGAGFEVAFATEPWNRDGTVFRIAPMIISDHLLSCAAFGDPAPREVSSNCSAASYYLVEAGVQWRRAFGAAYGFSFGFALDAGLQRLDGPRGPTSAAALGLTFPRLQLDF